MCHACIDATRVDEFGQRLLATLNQGATALMMSIGHRTGLFDTLATLPPSTSEDVAEHAMLNERYVREWLNAMVTARIVDYDRARDTYFLPREHAALLTRSASPDNLAVVAQFFSVLGSVEDDIVECFRSGGGVPYERFSRFHDVMAEESGQTVVAALMDHILPLAPGATSAMESGIDVLDIGCGCGRALNLMASRFPNSRFKGIDISREAIEKATREASARRLGNITFEVADAAAFEEPSRYHFITAFDAIHDQAHPDRVLRCVHAALRPGGTFLMQDIAGSSFVDENMDHLLAPFFYTISTMHCMTVSLASGGMGLGTLWGRQKAVSMLQDAGFQRVDIRDLPHDKLNHYYIARN